ncbi:MAG: type II toxin-antitoxin system HicA family toxin [Candidatus Gracilibacteria bacterium]|nr:type II toxin-antitoxin system HicA family toxin [Candidatus Gracilibacteria bacterium]
MPQLKPISWSDFVSRLRKLGFDGPYSGGKHLFMSKQSLTLTIPNKHGNKDISIGLLSRILKQAHISPLEWNNLQ